MRVYDKSINVEIKIQYFYLFLLFSILFILRLGKTYCALGCILAVEKKNMRQNRY